MNLEEEKSKLFFYTILTLIFVIAIILRVMTFVNHNYYITTDELHGICLGKETFKSIFTHNFSGANFLPLYGALLKILYDISNFNYAIIKLPSLIASIASIFVFYKLTSKVISNKVVILSALTVFALNYNLIYYSQMAKPYIFDVLFTLIILYSTLNIRDELNNNSFNFKKLMFTTICSMLIVYMSTPSIVVIQICFGLLFLENIYKKNFTALRKLIIFELFVGSTLCIEYFTYINQMQANSS